MATKSLTKKRRNMVQAIENELIKREMQNLGRWCEIKMRKDGRTLIVMRTGYGPMEYPEKDTHEIQDENNNLVAGIFDNLWDVANWIYDY